MSLVREAPSSALARAAAPLLALGLLAAGAAPALGQIVPVPLRGYAVHQGSHWTTEHGLPQNMVLSLLQSRDGYLWVGTGNGLARFDGVSFRVFDMTTTPGLASGWIPVLHEDGDGTLWIGTDVGVIRYRDGVFERQPLADGNGEGIVRTIQTDETGRLWVATERQVRYRDGDRWVSLPIGSVYVEGILVDREGTVWIGTDDGLLEWRGGVVRRLGAREGLPAGAVWPLLVDRAGALWVRGWPGLVRLDRESGKVDPAPGAAAEVHVAHLYEAEDGTLWIGALDALFSLDREGRLAAYPIATEGEQALVVAITEDREGQLWFGLSGGNGGLHRWSPRRVGVLAHEQGLPCDNAVAVTQASDGTVWAGMLCLGEAGLVAIRNGEVTTHRRAEDGSPTQVASLLALPEGGLWIGTYGGELLHLENGRFTRFTAENSGLTGRFVVALHRDDDGALWIGTERGLHRYQDGRWSRLGTADGLVHDDVRCIFTDAEGDLWIGTSGGVSRYAEGRFTNLTQDDGLPPGAVRAIHVDDEKTVWIGTYGGGLARFRDGRISAFGTQGGLLDSGVHKILEDDQGHFWMSGDRGIRRVRRSELNAFADGETTRLSVDSFDERDGMKNAEANGTGQPAGWRMEDGSLWFPTQGGLVRIDPEAVERAAVPLPVVIEAVRVEGVDYDPRQPITVPPGASDLEIDYTAPAFLRPEKIQFRYRLEGHDADWVDAGTRRIAHYANLAPGSYRFEVIARGGVGLWSEPGNAAELKLEPRLHQRPLVRLGMLLLLAAGVYALVRLRLVRLRVRALALETTVAERTTELRREREELYVANQRLGAAMRLVEESHTHLLSVLDQLRVGVIVVDAVERVLFVSEATSRLIAGAEEAIVGRRLGEVLPVPAPALEDLRMRLLAPRPDERTTARLEPQTGQRYWTEIEVRVDPRDERQRILYLYDVTETYELKHAEGDGDPGRKARLTGTSSAIRQVMAQIDKVASVDTTVLIEGETGTGKELVARSIHEASGRRSRPFVAINCAGLTESLLASQLFGHKRGAFTGAVNDHVGLFEAAQGGTLLLDEIGDMPLSMQTHLLRVLQEREIIRVGDNRPRPIDVRVLASTHRDLEVEVLAGRFREDLLYRIRVARILLPPLRQRIEDLPQLASAFASQFAAQHGKAIEGIGRAAMERLKQYRWPGNVRELKSTIEWAAVHSSGPLVRLADLSPDLAADGVPPARTSTPDAERQLLIETLRRTGGNRTVAARLLGISRSTLYRRLAALEEPPA